MPLPKPAQTGRAVYDQYAERLIEIWLPVAVNAPLEEVIAQSAKNLS